MNCGSVNYDYLKTTYQSSTTRFTVFARNIFTRLLHTETYVRLKLPTLEKCLYWNVQKDAKYLTCFCLMWKPDPKLIEIYLGTHAQRQKKLGLII